MSELMEAASKLGTAAAFLVSLLAGVVSVRSRRRVIEGDPELKDRVLHLERDNAHKDRLIDELKEKLEKVESRANASVTAEEFSAANQHVTTNVHTLTEKVGMLLGAVRGLEK